jgi:hypothetical protein
MNKSALRRLKAWLKEHDRTEMDDAVHTLEGSFITKGKTFELRASDIRALVTAAEGTSK